MGKKLAAAAITLCLPLASQAAVVSVDWLSSGDGLISRDDVSGLDWLDLTVTNYRSRDYILGQMDSGGLYEGWRYANADEVIALWSQFGVDLSPGTATTGTPDDPNVVQPVSLLGNTLCEYNCASFPVGTLGLVADEVPDNAGKYFRIGAYHKQNNNTYYEVMGTSYSNTDYAHDFFGHYLVQETAEVPVPASIVLLGSGLSGLLLARRRQ